MEEQWKILLYQTLQGDSPVKEFIDSLEQRAQAKVYDAINLLRNFGIRIGPPHVKKVTGTEMWELRILGADSIRVLYIAITGKTSRKRIKHRQKKSKPPKKDLQTIENEHKLRPCNYSSSAI